MTYVEQIREVPRNCTPEQSNRAEAETLANTIRSLLSRYAALIYADESGALYVDIGGREAPL